MEDQIEVDGKAFAFRLEAREGGAVIFSLDGTRYRAETLSAAGDRVRLKLNDRTVELTLEEKGPGRWSATGGTCPREVRAAFLARAAGWLRTRAAAPAAAAACASAGEGAITAPMPGKVLKVLAAPGDTVVKGQTLLTLEAMKMENQIQAPHDGTVDSVPVGEGAEVQKGTVLAVVKPVC